MSTRRLATAAGSVGLVAGIALGATGLASAAGSSPSPGPTTTSPAAPSAPGGHRGPGHGRDHFRGGPREALVVSFTDTSLVVRTPRGQQTVSLTGAAYFVDDTAASKAALTVGELVHLRLADPTANAPVATEVRVISPHLEGYVTAISGGTLTLRDTGGFVRTVTTSASTTYRKDGAAATASAVTVGSFVHARGTTSGTDLQASTVGLGRPGTGGRPGMDGPPPGAPGAPERDQPDAPQA